MLSLPFMKTSVVVPTNNCEVALTSVNASSLNIVGDNQQEKLSQDQEQWDTLQRSLMGAETEVDVKRVIDEMHSLINDNVDLLNNIGRSQIINAGKTKRDLVRRACLVYHDRGVRRR